MTGPKPRPRRRLDIREAQGTHEAVTPSGGAGRSPGAPDDAAIRELAACAAGEAVDRRGQDVVLLDLRGLTQATDYFVIASGESDIQVKAIAERIEERLREQRGVRPWHVEGLRHTNWVLLDYIDFVVHVFHRQARAYYDLERLWADAPLEKFPAEEDDQAAD
ncbi:MAG TPA: ribosome silencing factor [Thermoanaerobaculia bacterium]|nr:ribosome silencing factor [Thermoanaerobaculia bacterium]